MAIGIVNVWVRKARLQLRPYLGLGVIAGVLGIFGIPFAAAVGVLNYPVMIGSLIACMIALILCTWAADFSTVKRTSLSVIVILVFGFSVHIVNEAKVRAAADEREAKLEKNFGTLVPAGDAQPPQNKCVRTHPDAHFFVFFGNSIFVVNRFPTVLVKIDGRSYFSISKLPSGSVTLNVDIVDQEGKIIASIDGNNFRVNPNNIFDKKRPDESTLIVYDQFKTIVLSVRLDSSRYMTVSGSLNYKNRFMLLPDGSTVIGGAKGENNCSYGMSLNGDYFILN
jgi:hypothetical protein